MKRVADERCPDKSRCDCESYCERAQREHPKGTCFDWVPLKQKCPACRAEAGE
jgi:hypothetical protein